MALEPGARLGPYEITGRLGTGGMGVVYRARDTKPAREVAIKVLPDAFADDPERLARFDREARALASLNHPHIAGIHGVEGGGRAIVMEGGADVRYVSSGHLLYMQQGTLMAAPFDLDRLERTGAPVALVDRVMQAIGAYNGLDETRVGQFDVADNGTLIYLSSGLYPQRQAELVWVDRSGTPTPLPNMPPGGYLAPRVSPDGNRVPVQLTRGQSRLTDVRVYDVARRNHRTLALDGGEHGFPTWSPDGRELAFATRAGAAVNLSRVPIDGDGSGSGKRLMNSRHMQWPASWSSRHGVLAFLQRDRTIAELWMFPMSGDGEPKRFLDVPYSVTHVDFSPDGRWITYESRGEVYLQDYPTPGEPIPISVGAGPTRRGAGMDRSCTICGQRRRTRNDGRRWLWTSTIEKAFAQVSRVPCSRAPLDPQPDTLVRRRGRWPVHHGASGRRSRTAVHADGGRLQLARGAAPARAHALT